MKILMLAKYVPDTYGKRGLNLETGMMDRENADNVVDEINERVAEVAAQYKAQAADTEAIVLTVGPEDASSALRKILALSADRAIHVDDAALAGSDVVQTARVVAAVIEREKPDLVLTGSESTDGGTGMLPAMIGELTGATVLAGLDEVTIEASAVQGVQREDTTVTTLRAELPAVVAVTEKVAEPRMANFKAIREAKKKPVENLTLADLNLSAGPDAAYVRSVMVAAEQRPPRTAGPKVAAEDDAAVKLVDFLAERHLI